MPRRIERFIARRIITNILEKIKETSMIEFFKGKKTYLVAAGMIVYAVLGMQLGQLDQDTTVQLILQALGFTGLRLGIAKGS